MHFVFCIDADTVMSIASEMAEELDLSNDDVATIAELIADFIFKLTASQKYSFGSSTPVNNSSNDSTLIIEDHIIGEVITSLNQGKTSISDVEFNNVLRSLDNELEYIQGSKIQTLSNNKGSLGDAVMSDCTKNPGISFDSLQNVISNDFSSDPSPISFIGEANDKNRLQDLKLELDAINMQYQQSYRELSRMREEAIENVRKKWTGKKKICT